MREARRLLGPALAPLVRDRPAAAAISIVAALHLALAGSGAAGWRCPSRAVLGIRCPGCGLTGALLALARRDFAAMLALHALAPAAVAVLVLLATAAVLPAGPREALARSVERCERRTGVTFLVFVALLVYWMVRIGH